jgi:N-acetylglutamate synthase-like GNAT family acetyltransferase
MSNERQEARKLTLSDGVVVFVRTVRPDDAPALQRLHSRLSEQSIRSRFFSSMKKLSDQQAKHFAHVDGINRYALIALDPEKQEEIIAVVRFSREGSTAKAEYAALVEDHWQSRGVGLSMTRRLIDEARDRGIRYLYGLIMPENQGMLKLLRSLDLPERESRSEGIKYVEVELVA